MRKRQRRLESCSKTIRFAARRVEPRTKKCRRQAREEAATAAATTATMVARTAGLAFAEAVGVVQVEVLVLLAAEVVSMQS